MLMQTISAGAFGRMRCRRNRRRDGWRPRAEADALVLHRWPIDLGGGDIFMVAALAGGEGWSPDGAGQGSLADCLNFTPIWCLRRDVGWIFIRWRPSSAEPGT